MKHIWAFVATDVRRWNRLAIRSASSRRRLQQLAAVCLGALLAGCSSFNRDWKRAAVQPQPTEQLAGRWQGHWMSDRNGHNGELRCLMTQTGENGYDARFHAKYWKILRFGYTVPLKVQRSNEVYQFAGEANLGKLAGGVYRYSGKVAGTNFHSTYRSKYDYGYFRMNRVP